MNRMIIKSNESIHGRLGMSSEGEGMKCERVEVVGQSTLRWFNHLWIMK